MPQLIVQNDPYIAANASALNDFAGSLGGGGIEAQAKAQALAAQMRLANSQQQHLAQQMRIEQEKYNTEKSTNALATKQSTDLQDSMGRYASMSTPRPSVHSDGSAPSQQELDQWYAQQNMNDQMARATGRLAKGSEDFNKGYGSYMDNFRSAAPPVAVQNNSTQFQVPQTPAGLNADGAKKFQELNAARASKFYENQASSSKLLEDTVRARQAYDQGRGYLGPVQSNFIARTSESMLPFGFDKGETTRSDVENKLAAYQKSLVMQNLPPGPASDKDIEQARKGMASIYDRSPEAGLSSIDRDLAQVVKNMGHDIPAAHITELMNDIKTQNMPEIQNFIAAHPGSEQVVKMIFESLR
jgi:hypothetical protein